MKKIDIDEVAEELSCLLPIFHQKFIRPLEHQSKNFMSPMLMHTIAILANSDILTMTELSHKLKVSKQQMTTIVDKLIENDFVYRKHDEIDRRSIKIGLTSSGSDFFNNFKRNITNDIKIKIEHLNKDDLISLHNTLGEFYRIIHMIK